MRNEDWSAWWIGAALSVSVVLGVLGAGADVTEAVKQQSVAYQIGHLVGYAILPLLIGGGVPWVYYKARRKPARISAIVSGIVLVSMLYVVGIVQH